MLQSHEVDLKEAQQETILPCAMHSWLREYNYKLDLAFNNVNPNDWYFVLD